MLTFDETHLVHRLDRLPHWGRVAFAASAATRLCPLYQVFSVKTSVGDTRAIATALNVVWRYLAGERVSDEDILSHIQTVTNNMPDTCATPFHAYAEDAAAAIIYTLRALLTGDSQEAVWAARRVYEALDYRVVQCVGVDTSAPGAERQALADPLVQRELRRQDRDLNDLSQGVGVDPATLAMLLRRRAEQAPALPLDATE